MIGRPRVTLTYAQSLDGSIASRRGEPIQISGPESSQLTHRLRAEHDAILVGIGTVLADDPQLTVRLVEGSNPQPIILDSQLRFPAHARLMQNPRKPWIFSRNASEEKVKLLESAGIKVIEVPASKDGRVDLPAMLKRLSDFGIRTLMVEGGAGIISSFLRENLVDEVILTIAPRFIGGLRAVESITGDQQNFPELLSPTWENFGKDWVIRGQLKSSNG